MYSVAGPLKRKEVESHNFAAELIDVENILPEFHFYILGVF
jgi:hypothetical protein